MRNKFFIELVLMFVALFFLNSSLIKAQESNTVMVKSEAIELDVASIYIPCEDPLDPNCEPYPENTVHPDPANPDHELGLSNQGFPPNTDVYLVGCINTGSGIHCTTGSQELDEMLNNLPGGDTMIPDPSYQFKALTNPVKTDENGNLSVIVRSFTPQVTSHIFNAYLVYEENTSPTSVAITPLVTPEEALHLQTFTQVTPTEIPIRVRPNQVIRRHLDWDPKGRLFDIKSLEPVTGIEVTLLDNFRNLFSYKSIINPQLVQANGEFNFWVPNGIYYLQFAKLPETHLWPVDMKNVHPNYSLAYYCDPEVKDSENLAVPLYYNQFSIIEFNKLVHCDVPIDPGTNTPWRSPVRTIDYGLTRGTLDGSFTYSGKVTHPFTKVQLVAQSTDKIVKEVEADKLGFWRTTLLASSYPLTNEGIADSIVLRYIKKDLTGSQAFESIGGLTLEPLLSYVEGYAYDQGGNIIANAKVGIKQKNSDKVIYLTTADDKGYFRIGTQYLPSLPYDLVFSNSDNNLNVMITSSQFLKANTKYLQDKQLNLISANNREVPLATVSISSFRAIKGGQPQVGQEAESQQAAITKSANPFSLILITILLIASMIGILFLVLKKKPSLPIS